MLQIPRELVEQIVKEQCTLFIGAGISLGAHGQRGLPDLGELAKALSAHCDYPGNDLSLPKVAQFYEIEKGRQELIAFLKNSLDDTGLDPLYAHRLIAQLPFHVLITTGYDRLLERALLAAGKEHRIAVCDEDIPYLDTDKVMLFKLHGTLDQPESLVVTEDDYFGFFEKLPTISDAIKTEFAARTLLFIGYDLEDSSFQQLYMKILNAVHRHKRRAYAVQREPSDYACKYWQKKGVTILTADVTEFLQELRSALERFATFSELETDKENVRNEQITLIHKRPYKDLNSYEPEDEDIFFGRHDEVWKLLSLIGSYRVSVLYGESGSGKTSLLNAGVIPHLKRQGYVVVSTRVADEPVEAIKAAVAPLFIESLIETQQLCLRDFLIQVSSALGKLIIIILDQFEEFFIHLSEESRQKFIAELGAVYRVHDLPVKFVFSLRKEFLAEMSELEEQVHEIFHNKLQLHRLTRKNAIQAIIGPARAFGKEYEHDLLDTLLQDLYANGLYPPHLQLVCNTLYDRLGEYGQRITLSMYLELGRAEAILSGYLEEKLAEFTGDQRLLARAILVELVTSRKTKAVPSEIELAQHLGKDTRDCQEVIYKLMDKRLLQSYERNGVHNYELVHEYLINEIDSWIDEEERGLKKARELLEQELDNAKRFRTTMNPEYMEMIDKHRTKLHLTADAEVLLLQSALQHNYQIEHWQNIVTDIQNRLKALAQTLSDGTENTRIRAIQSLPTMLHESIVELLTQTALTDPSDQVRETSAKHLAELRNPILMSKFSHLVEVGSAEESKRAVEALAYLLDVNRYGHLLAWPIRVKVIRQLITNRFRKHRQQAQNEISGATVGGVVGGSLCMWLITYSTGSSAVESIFAGILFGIPLGFLLGSFIAIGLSLRLFFRRNTSAIIGTLGATVGGYVAAMIWHNLMAASAEIGSGPTSLTVFSMAFGGIWGIGLWLMQRLITYQRQVLNLLDIGISGILGGVIGAIFVESLIHWGMLSSSFDGTPLIRIIGFSFLGTSIAIGCAISRWRMKNEI